MASAAAPSITAANLEDRLKAFQQIVAQGGSGTPSADYVTGVEAALAQVTQSEPVDARVAQAVWKKDGWFSGHYEDSAGAHVTKAQIDAAKELAPADAMIRATLQSLLERDPANNDRKLGRSVQGFQQDMQAAEARAASALADLKAGKPNAGAALADAIAGIRALLQKAAAEADSDARAISSLRSDVEQFAPVANDTGLFSHRPTENASINAARAINDGLQSEPAAEHQLAGTGPSVVRPYVIGRLESDAAMADRGYNTVVARREGWASIMDPTQKSDAAAQQLAAGIGTYGQALTTVAQGPQTLANLDQVVAQTRVDYQQGVANLQAARQAHASASTSLAIAYTTAEVVLGQANINARAASNTADNADTTRRSARNAYDQWSSRVSDLEDQLNHLKNDNSNRLPGTSPSNSGNRLPGTSGGNRLPGTGTSSGNNAAAIAEVERDLANARSSRSAAGRDVNAAESTYSDAVDYYNSQAAVASQAQVALGIVVQQQRDNDLQLASVEQQTAALKGAFAQAQQARSDAAAAIDNAKSTISSASSILTAAADAYNKALAAELTAAQHADIGGDGQKQLKAIAAQSIPTQLVAQAVQAGDQGIDALRKLAQALTDSSSKRSALANQEHAQFTSQADTIIDTAVSEALK